MSQDEEQYKKELAKNGVDLPELEDAPKEEPKVPEAPKEVKKDEPEDLDEHLQDTPKEPRKRSIYDEYKDKKSELKEETTKREQAERERDDLRTKLEALGKADTVEERKDAQDEIDQFLTSHKEWDKSAIKDLLDIARKGTKADLDEATKKDLADFKVWKSANAKTIEQQMFNEEFDKITPSLKESFPTASDEELGAIKKELDALSHTKEWHDKDLDYVAFKHKDKLSQLVSPKKRGMESKDRKDISEQSFDFDPNADYASMTSAERKSWETAYKASTKGAGIITDSKGRKLIV